MKNNHQPTPGGTLGRNETTMATIIITEAMAQAYAENAAAELSELLGTNEAPNVDLAYSSLKEIALRAIERAIAKPAADKTSYLPNGEEA
jgi:hypothetical protein